LLSTCQFYQILPLFARRHGAEDGNRTRMAPVAP